MKDKRSFGSWMDMFLKVLWVEFVLLRVSRGFFHLFDVFQNLSESKNSTPAADFDPSGTFWTQTPHRSCLRPFNVVPRSTLPSQYPPRGVFWMVFMIMYKLCIKTSKKHPLEDLGAPYTVDISSSSEHSRIQKTKSPTAGLSY